MTEAITKVDKFLGQFQVTHVHNDTEYNQAFELLKKIKKAMKILETDRKERTRSLLDEKKAIDAEYKPGMARAKELEADLKRILQEYKRDKEAKRKELSEGPITREKMNALAETHTPEPEGMSIRKVQVLEIFDDALLPAEYLLPNEPAIKAALKEGKTIPGARLVEKEIMAVRS